MPCNQENEDYPTVEEQHREYLYDLLEQRARVLASKQRLDHIDLAELAQIENIAAFYRIDVERDQCRGNGGSAVLSVLRQLS